MVSVDRRQSLLFPNRDSQKILLFFMTETGNGSFIYARQKNECGDF